MSRILPASVSAWLAARHVAAGVDLRIGDSVSAIEADGVVLANGDRIAADVVLLATGAAPAVAALDGLVDGSVDGVPTDAHCRVAGRDDIYAIGDVALTDSPIYGRAVRQETWRNAENQAEAVAGLLMGGVEPYAELPWMWTDQLGHNIQVVGFCDGDREVVRGDLDAGSGCVFHLQGDRLVGAVLINSGRERRHVERLVLARTPVDAAQLADPGVALKGLA